MSDGYVLTRDIIYDHNERMLNIKKYYPFFRLSDISFHQYKDGIYENLDMGYILMAVLRFFIEQNNFNEELVTYEQYMDFASQLLRRDFDLSISEDDEKELIGFIFDKIRNDGKPFVYEYFNPVNKKKQIVRIRLINSKIIDENVRYFITSDAIEFYLDTKEIRDESNITTDQLLLGKLISSKNFKGGTEVVRRINNEVARLIMKKNEVLNILSYDVFQGAKAYEEFTTTGIRWFEEEHKLFKKNKELIEQALRQGESEHKFYSAMNEIYQLEAELNKAITKHSRLLSECMDLQIKADDIISRAKYGKLRTSFDFREYLKQMMQIDKADILPHIMLPLLGLNIKKRFSIANIDNMLTYKAENTERGEKITEAATENYVYEDEVEEQRINDNYDIFIDDLFGYINDKKEITLNQWLTNLKCKCGDGIIKNGDLYSFLVHLCQKKEYCIEDVISKPDTFLEEIIKNHCMKDNKFTGLTFTIENGVEEINLENVSDICDMKFICTR